MFQEERSSSSVTSIQVFPLMSLSSSPYQWLKELKPEERGLYLIHLLVSCARQVSSGHLENANMALDQISHLASAEGDTMQRIASYFSEALADRILRMWPGVHKAFHLTRALFPAEEMAARRVFSEALPFMKVASVITNQVIIEAMEGEKMVHVIDLNAAEPVQWCALIRDLAARPEGPPHLRITGVHHQKEVLDQVAHVLTEEAEKLDIPFQFIPIVAKLELLDLEKLRVKRGEALAISSAMKLHELLASPNNSSASSSPPLPASRIDSFISSLSGLSPKVMVITEHDSNHNGKSLMERLSESLYFYAALFDCLESALPRGSLERCKVEKTVLGEEIKNIIACEGSERRHRHERIEKWNWRFESAGFAQVPHGYYGLLKARRLLLQSFNCEGYRIKEENGCASIFWHDRPLFSVAAWRCRR